jgi:hypothetical protein
MPWFFNLGVYSTVLFGDHLDLLHRPILFSILAQLWKYRFVDYVDQHLFLFDYFVFLAKKHLKNYSALSRFDFANYEFNVFGNHAHDLSAQP